MARLVCRTSPVTTFSAQTSTATSTLWSEVKVGVAYSLASSPTYIGRRKSIWWIWAKDARTGGGGAPVDSLGWLQSRVATT